MKRPYSSGDANSTRGFRLKVETAEDGRLFVWQRQPDGSVKKSYGRVGTCVKCSKEFFTRRKLAGTCSMKCQGLVTRETLRRKSAAKGPKVVTLDGWFSRIIRSVGACVRCGKTSALQCAHIVSRRYFGVRFSLDNAMCLCSGCHMFFTHHPLEWEEFVTDRIGREAFDDIKRRAREYRGPFDHKATATALHEASAKLGISVLSVRNGQFKMGEQAA